MKRTLRCGVVTMMLLVGACGDDGGGADPPVGGDGGGDDTAVATGNDHLSVVIDGGPDAGTYERDGDARCTVGILDEGGWGNQYSEASLMDGLTSVQAIVPNYADGPVTEGFTVTVTIGPFLEGGAAYDITSGTATVDDSGGNDAALTVEGETEDGIGVTVEVDCGSVMRF